MISDNELYTRYRSGLIRRHIANNGRLLEGIWLVEKTAESGHRWEAIRRSTAEKLASGTDYQYEAYPLIVREKFYNLPEMSYVAGGGDNPLLMGGLAMTVFSVESILNVSSKSMVQAMRLAKFAYNSQARNRSGGQTGFWTRKRHIFRASDQYSVDEICGMLLGFLFATKAARRDGDAALEGIISAMAQNLGRYLQESQYYLRTLNVPGRGNPDRITGQDAFVFQFPFGKALEEITGNSWQSGVTIPDNYGPANGIASFLKGFVLDFDYTPRDLFKDLIGTMGGLYNLTDEGLYNVTMMVYCLIMVLESTETHDDGRKEFAQLGNDVLKALMYDNGALDGGKKPFRNNCFFAVVAKRCAQICGDEDRGWISALSEKIKYLADGGERWFPDLPLGTPSDSQGTKFKTINQNGRLLWGGWYAWTADGRDSEPKYTFMVKPDWDLGKAISRIGPTGARIRNVTAESLRAEYEADPGLGLRVESSGLDFLIARSMAAYYQFLPTPNLQDGDPDYSSLPLDGPMGDGFLGNASTGEAHDLSVREVKCQVDKILPRNERWYATYWEVNAIHHYNDCAKCLPVSRQYPRAIRSAGSAYVGNRASNVIHDKENKKMACNLLSILPKNILYYAALSDAHIDGLDSCAFCIGANDH